MTREGGGCFTVLQSYVLLCSVYDFMTTSEKFSFDVGGRSICEMSLIDVSCSRALKNGFTKHKA